MDEQPDLEQLKRVVPKKVFDQFKAELEMSQGRLLLIWLWRAFLMFVLPWRWYQIHDFLRPWREHRRRQRQSSH